MIYKKEGKNLFKKNTPLKIVLIIFITEIIILVGLRDFYTG